MSKDKLKKLSIELSEDCLINLKIISLQKRIKLAELARNVLESFSDKSLKKNTGVVATEEEK